MKSVLWTGGWDSTYRVLDLSINKGIAVQPYYVLDRGRRSTPVELETMEKIRHLAGKHKTGADTLILDPILISITDIPADDEVTTKYKSLATRSHLGTQYDWLGRYVRSIGLTNLELCIHRDDKAEAFIRNDVHLTEDEGGEYYRLRDKPADDALLIFSNYSFPLLNSTKIMMGKDAEKSGFAHIMEETWFCFNPTSKKTPCGLCNPCKYTREEGLGRRVPSPSLARKGYARVRQGLSKLKKSLSAK